MTLESTQFFAISKSILKTSIQEVPFSSTVVFEVNSANEVSAWFNDEPVGPAGCDGTCTVEEYTSALQKMVVYTDLQKACL